MRGGPKLSGRHDAIRAAARHLIEVAVSQRGYRAAAPGLLNDLVAAMAPCVAAVEPARAWHAYVAAWSTTRIAADWEGFAAATQAMMPCILAGIDAQEAQAAHQAMPLPR